MVQSCTCDVDLCYSATELVQNACIDALCFIVSIARILFAAVCLPCADRGQEKHLEATWLCYAMRVLSSIKASACLCNGWVGAG